MQLICALNPFTISSNGKDGIAYLFVGARQNQMDMVGHDYIFVDRYDL